MVPLRCPTCDRSCETCSRRSRPGRTVPSSGSRWAMPSCSGCRRTVRIDGSAQASWEGWQPPGACNRRSVSTASSRPTLRSSSFRRARTGIRILGEICRIRQQSLSEIVTAITRFADETQGNDKASAIDAIQAHVVLGQLHAYSGRMAEAIDQFAKAQPEGRERFSRCRAPDRGNARHFVSPQIRTRQRRIPLARGPLPVASKDDACCRDTRFAEGDRVLHRHSGTPTAGLRGEVVAEPGVHDHRRLPRPGALGSLDTRIDVRVARDHRALRRRGSGGRCEFVFVGRRRDRRRFRQRWQSRDSDVQLR